jgi:integrase
VPRRKRTQRLKMPNGAGSITLRSDGRYMARYTATDPETGQAIRKALYGRTEQEARAKLIAALSERADGTLVVFKGRVPTVEQYAARWLAGKEERVRPRTIHRYREILDNHVIPRIGKVQLVHLRPSQIDSLMTEVVREGRSARTANYCRQTLRAMLNQAMVDGIVGRNVAQLARPLPQRDDQLRVMSPDTVPALLRAAEANDDGPLWLLALATGARLSELLGLEWRHWRGQRLRIERTIQYEHGDGGGFMVLPCKTDRSNRIVILPEIAVQALNRQREHQDEARRLAGPRWTLEYGDLIFSGPCGEPLKVTTVSKRWRRFLAGAKLPHIPFHGLRHSAASLLAAKRVPLLDVSRMLGHSQISTTSDLYTELFDDTRRATARAMERALGEMRDRPKDQGAPEDSDGQTQRTRPRRKRGTASGSGHRPLTDPA